MDTVLELKGVNKYFPGVRALSDMNFSLERGEIHALLGENGAGKSTLIKIIAGVYKPDDGELWINGAKTALHGPLDAIKAGIGVVYQETSLFPDLSIMENLFVGRLPGRGLLKSVDFKHMRKTAQDIYDNLGLQTDVKRKVSTLGIADRQMLEIAKALSQNSNILILDEPTAALSAAEVDTLFRIIKELREKGVSIIYISHRLEEIFQVADRITVIRDGQYVATEEVGKVDTPQLVQWMVGRSIDNFYPKVHGEVGETILQVRGLSDGDMVQDVSFDLHKGEILGFSGLAGSGRTETATALAGLTKRVAGELTLAGNKLEINNYRDALRSGIVYVSEDRQRHGVTLPMSIKDNITLSVLTELCKFGVINKKQDVAIAQEYMEKLQVAAPGYNSVVGNLSGGNQQKVSVSKALATQNPQVLILDEPTRGVDVGAKTEIYNLISQLAQGGMAIIMISSELPEIIGMSDRVIVFRHGRSVGDVPKDKIEQEYLLSLALQVEAEGA